MELILNRTYLEDATLGHLVLPDGKVFHTIERPWLDNKQYVSCIPEGIYTVAPYDSHKFPDVWEIKDVKDRSLILIHVANWAFELQGCIGVGVGATYLNHNKVAQKAVTGSVRAMNELKDILDYPSEFKLRITGLAV